MYAGEARERSLATMSDDTAARREPGTPVYDASSTSAAVPVDNAHTLHNDVLQREKERFGGIKFGSAFFGWLTATGTAVLLTALAASIGAAVGLNAAGTVEEAADEAASNAGAVGIVGAIILAVVLFVAYFAGGYVAGRMARFSGAKQGLAVWIWAIVIAIVVAILTAVAGSQWDILSNLDSFPRIPISAESATLTGILTAIGAAVVALVGAILGGLVGMRFHRKVDRVGLGR
jgi:MFS family permease